jgi:LDH2 family malate/lactate/ureidoglycolate dehydrogenase
MDLRLRACAGVEKARASRFAVVGLHDSFLSGRNAYYLEMISRAGLGGIHAACSAPGVDEIRIPSERAFAERERRRREGIVLERSLYEHLCHIRFFQMCNHQMETTWQIASQNAALSRNA